MQGRFIDACYRRRHRNLGTRDPRYPSLSDVSAHKRAELPDPLGPTPQRLRELIEGMRTYTAGGGPPPSTEEGRLTRSRSFAEERPGAQAERAEASDQPNWSPASAESWTPGMP